MRTVGFSNKTDDFEKMKQASTDMLEALVVRELQNLAVNPELNGKQIIALERLGNLLLKKKASDREETILLSKLNGGKKLEISDEELAGLLGSLGVSNDSNSS